MMDNVSFHSCNIKMMHGKGWEGMVTGLSSEASLGLKIWESTFDEIIG